MRSLKTILLYITALFVWLPFSYAQVGDSIIIWDTNYGDSGGTGMLYLNEGAPQMINEGPSIGNPDLFEIPITGAPAGILGVRELCDFTFVGSVTEGPDFIIQINVPVEKRISCQDATYTICRRGDFGHPAERVYIVDEDGLIISFIDSSGGGSTSDCTPDQQCVTGTISPCAINSMVADGVISFSIHTPGGNPGTTAADVDAVCNATSGGGDGDYDNDGTVDGNCVELTAFSFVVATPDSSFTVDGVASLLVDGMVYCPNEIIDLAPNQMNSCDQQFSVNGVDVPTGNYTLTTPGMYEICNTVGKDACTPIECTMVVVEPPSMVEAGPDEIICANDVFPLAGASTDQDSAYWRIITNPGNAILSNSTNVIMPEMVTFTAPESGTYILELTTIGLCDTVKDSRTIQVNGTAVNNTIIYEETCETLVADFTLEEGDLTIEPTGSATITYHASLSDAMSGTGILFSPYTAVNGTIVYARVEDAVTGCITYAELIVRVVPNNGPTGPDKDGDGIEDGTDRDDDNDGIPDNIECNMEFDLSDRSLLIGTDPANLQVGDKVLYNDAIIVDGVVYDLVGEVTSAFFSDPNGAVSITGVGDPFDLIEPEPETDDYATMKLSLVVNGSATAATPMGTMTTIPYIFISINDVDSDSQDYTDIVGVSIASQADNTYLNVPTDLVVGDFINGGGPTGFNTYYLDPASVGNTSNWADEGGVTGIVATTLNAVNYEFLDFSMFELVVGVTGNTGNPTNRFSRMEIETCPDSDGDGVPDHKDLDSDNDGIPDIIEACGDLSLITENCMLDQTAYPEQLGDAPLNCPTGFYETPTACDPPIDTDMDGTPDYLDTDSDGDGCDDTCEAGTPDEDADGIAGTGTAIVDVCGRVAGLCTIPVDNTWLDTSLQFTLDIIGDCDAMSAQNYPSNVTFQWYLNEELIIGATGDTYIPDPRKYGDYTVVATKTATCTVTSMIVTTCCEPPILGISGN